MELLALLLLLQLKKKTPKSPEHQVGPTSSQLGALPRRPAEGACCCLPLWFACSWIRLWVPPFVFSIAFISFHLFPNLSSRFLMPFTAWAPCVALRPAFWPVDHLTCSSHLCSYRTNESQYPLVPAIYFLHRDTAASAALASQASVTSPFSSFTLLVTLRQQWRFRSVDAKLRGENSHTPSAAPISFDVSVELSSDGIGKNKVEVRSEHEINLLPYCHLVISAVTSPCGTHSLRTPNSICPKPSDFYTKPYKPTNLIYTIITTNEWQTCAG